MPRVPPSGKPSNVEGNVRAEGDLDFRGTLDNDRDTSVGCTAVRLHLDLRTSATPEEVTDLI